MKILVFGLPGSGKTWITERLVLSIDNCAWYNADVIRKCANDWDFSFEGRIRQANRMKSFADFERSQGRWVICDFVAPTKKARDAFGPDYTIWLDTITEGRIVSSKLNELKTGAKIKYKLRIPRTKLSNPQSKSSATDLRQMLISNFYKLDQTIASKQTSEEK